MSEAKRYLVAVKDYSEGSADDLRCSLLDGWGFPISIDKNPDDLQVIELLGIDDSIAKQLQRSMERNARMVTRLQKLGVLIDRSQPDLYLQTTLHEISQDQEPTWPEA